MPYRIDLELHQSSFSLFYNVFPILAKQFSSCSSILNKILSIYVILCLDPQLCKVFPSKHSFEIINGFRYANFYSATSNLNRSWEKCHLSLCFSSYESDFNSSHIINCHIFFLMLRKPNILKQKSRAKQKRCGIQKLDQLSIEEKIYDIWVWWASEINCETFVQMCGKWKRRR